MIFHAKEGVGSTEPRCVDKSGLLVESVEMQRRDV